MLYKSQSSAEAIDTKQLETTVRGKLRHEDWNKLSNEQNNNSNRSEVRLAGTDRTKFSTAWAKEDVK